MKLIDALGIIYDFKFVFQAAFIPTLVSLWQDPSLIFHPVTFSQLVMAHVWMSFGDGVDANSKDVKENLITPNAEGVVLDIGAGHGHSIHYLDKRRVQTYIALEPNPHMHVHIRRLATQTGYTELLLSASSPSQSRPTHTFLILPYPAASISSIISTLKEHGLPPRVDTLISILTLCTIPEPEETLHVLVNQLLRPAVPGESVGGQLLCYEHVKSEFEDVAWWQHFWTPVWKRGFDGCELDRDIEKWLKEVKLGGKDESVWMENKMWRKEGENEKHLFGHRIGRFVRK